MSTEFFKFPTQKDWKRINNVSPFKKIYSVLDCLEDSEHTTDSLNKFTRNLELKSWLYELRKRVEDTVISYFFMMFYYEKGIPDKRWYISPGKDGASVQFYPDFNETDYSIKIWFDYFSDTLYYKLFSAWDILGHFLNVKYDLEIRNKDVYFSTALRKLESKDRNLYTCLNDIKNSPVYEEAHKIRRNITHNCLPRNADINVRRCGESIKIGLKEYIPSEKIVINVQGALELFADTLQCISK